jgi:hypothetical protein
MTDDEIEIRFELIQQEIDRRFADLKEQVQIAREAMEKRLDNLQDQAGTSLPRQEYIVQHQALADRLTELADRLERVNRGG